LKILYEKRKCARFEEEGWSSVGRGCFGLRNGGPVPSSFKVWTSPRLSRISMLHPNLVTSTSLLPNSSQKHQNSPFSTRWSPLQHREMLAWSSHHARHAKRRKCGEMLRLTFENGHHTPYNMVPSTSRSTQKREIGNPGFHYPG
jgi:hypothetical protein